MKRISIMLAAVALAALACQQAAPTAPTANSVGTPLFASQANNGNGVLHKVSAGGADVDFSAHTDANFSLTAIEHGDGSVTGEWSDQFGQGDGGIHVAVDCLEVDGNQAWIGGEITHGTANGVDVTGERALTRVADIGTSANDPPDLISFSVFPVPPQFTCHGKFDLPLFPMTDGQVTVN